MKDDASNVMRSKNVNKVRREVFQEIIWQATLYGKKLSDKLRYMAECWATTRVEREWTQDYRVTELAWTKLGMRG